MSSQDPVDRFRLSDVEALVLELAKLDLMWNDRQLDGADRSKQYLKRLVIQDFVTSVGRKLGNDEGAGRPVDALPQAVAAAGGDPTEPWVSQIQQAVASNFLSSWLDLLHEDQVVEELGRLVTEESRAALLVIELGAFSPWGDNKTMERHEDDWHRHVCQFLAGLPVMAGKPQAQQLLNDLEEAVNHLRAGRRLSKAALVAVVAGGVAVGAVTGGLAAPLVGEAIGGAMGLAGAAATNAGLALLGGGSLAAGGVGMAGGTALVMTGFGAVGGAGAGAAGTKVKIGGSGPAGASPMGAYFGVPLGSPEEELAECAKLLVVVPDIVIAIENDHATAELILNRLRERHKQAENERDATEAPARLGRHSPPSTRRAEILRRAVERLERVVG